MESPSPAIPPRPKVNLRTPEVMERVQAEVEEHYRSELVERIRAQNGVYRVGNTTIRLAREFGFCYGVERAIDLAYAARKVFPDRRVYLLGEIIHNPDVNAQLAAMGITNLVSKSSPAFENLERDDVVIVPAFGAEVKTVATLREHGCQIVDTTCGDVMSVWRRVRQNAKDGVTSIIHGKAEHEETRATASHALGDKGHGHYLIVLNLQETGIVCDYIRTGGNAAAFLKRFEGAYSPGFDPDVHLEKVGVANQTTMLREETNSVQQRIREAISDRDGDAEKFRFFDTICGATQDRQDALFHLLEEPLHLMIVVGGYNSSNTTHLVEISQQKLPTYFIQNASRMIDANTIQAYDIHKKQEITDQRQWLAQDGELIVGITAGASCPNNLIEETILRVLALRNESGSGNLS
ncbi:MAG: 4-hydroxy-3-methylbut-2-enyl diphosphate reductase [Chthoniobacterales bacterium]